MFITINWSLWLKLVAQTINNLFNGIVSQYLSYQPVFLSDELRPILQQHYQRLSEIEKHAIALIDNETEPILFAHRTKAKKTRFLKKI